ncbi:carbohydrate ABC transporter permease [Mollicutes bacterium LVI A0039]|nr:carbohydrate ABC transporter permease [Mollicutes bacterium LVI A0039]
MKDKILKVVLYTIVFGYAIFTLFPFVWAVAASFKPVSEIVGGNLSIIPENPTLDAYKSLLVENNMFWRWLLNSFFISGVATVCNVLFNTMAGYSLARIHFRGKNLVANLIIATITIPGQVLLIPNYVIVTQMGLNNTYTAVILLSAINASYIIMMRQFFINFPREVEEAGQIDGLSRFGIFFRLSFPIAKPAIATQSLFIFMGVWNEFLKTKLYLSSPDKYTITVGLQALSQSQGDSVPWDLVMASSVMSIVPMIILYIILNRYFLEGVRIGGDK